MNKTNILLAVMILVGVNTCIAQEAVDGRLVIDLDATYVSKYIWRGFDLLDDKSAFQPSINIDLFGTGFSLNVWVSYAGSSGTSDVSTVNATEYDYTLAYAFSLFEGESYVTDVTANFIYYDFIDEPDKGSSQNVDSEELGVEFAWPELFPGGIVPSYYVSKIWSARSSPTIGSNYSGWFHIFGLGYDLAVPGILPDTPEQVFSLSASAVYNDGYIGADHDWSHVVWGVSTGIEVGPGTFTPALYYQTSMDDSVNPEDELWTSMSYAIRF